MYTVAKEFKWDAAHRLLGYRGLCRSIHGHQWGATITLSFAHKKSNLDSMNFVKDFTEFKVIKKWIDENWDHTLILNEKDPLLKALEDQELRISTTNGNPTAEVMAYMLYKVADNLFAPDFEIVSVEVKETTTSTAIYYPDEK